MRPEARTAVAEGMARWANPSSPHREGRAARAALEEARERIKAALGWRHHLIFTSGASEALRIALGGKPVLASAVEHDAVFRAAPGARLLPVGRRAQLDRDALADALRDAPPFAVAVQHVNSETGVMQPVAEIAAQVRAAGGVLICDCAQSAGKFPLPDCDMAVISAHKLGGPPGIGALLVRDLALLAPTGGQEFGYRAGTENLPGILGFAAATDALGIVDGAAQWRRDLERSIRNLGYRVGQAGGACQPTYRLDASDPAADAPLFDPTIRAITMPRLSASAQLIRFDSAGFAVSAGSACASGSLKPSRTLAAFGVPEEEASRTIRVSFGWSTTPHEIGRFLEAWLTIAGAGSRAA